MNKRFKPLLAVAFAAGLLPAINPLSTESGAFAATVASFTFESLTGSTAATNSYSIAADSGLATLTLLKTGTAATVGIVAGNGSAKSLTGSNMIGASLTFGFSLDSLSAVTLSFDTIGSGTGPRDFVVQYSLDGTTFSNLSSYSIANSTYTYTGAAVSTNSTGGTFSSFTATGFNTAGSISNFNQSFALSSDFADPSTALGDIGYLRILQSGTANITGGTAASTGTLRYDNVLIQGTVPEPATAAIFTLASAGAALRRRRKA